MAAPRTVEKSELYDALATCRAAFVSLGIFSMFINLLMLTGPLFMLQIYDRVLTSGSVPTLVALSVLAIVLYASYGFLEFIRSRLLVRVGRIVDEVMRDRVFDAVSYHALRQTTGVRTTPLHDLQTIRSFLQSNGPNAFLDMPWAPIYLAVIFLMHFVLGLASTIAAVLLVIIAIITDRTTRRHAQVAQRASNQAAVISEECRTNVEATHVLGMLGAMRGRWQKAQNEALDSHMLASDRGGLLSSMSKTLRLVFQSMILAVGAYLAVQQEITPGTMIAASIIMSRALAPLEMAVAQWSQFQGFVRSWQRLKRLLQETPEKPRRMDLPRPRGRVTVENLAAYAPNADKPLVGGISFDLPPGAGLGIIGPTGAGKSTLARALVNAWPFMRGQVRIDGATLDQWDPDVLGASLGYLPQEVELFDGTLGQNISRFASEPDAQAIVKAAQQANVHDLVLRMPDGYNTLIGEGGVKLSAGQRQRIGLARALYGDPVLIVLDEPNSNLDAEGETALVQSIVGARERGATVIVIAHRPSAIAALDQLMVLRDGRPVAFGPKEEVLKKVMARPIDTSGRPGGLAVISETRT